MHRLPAIPILVFLCALGSLPARPQGNVTPRASDGRYSGMCDASTAVAIGPDRFVVASDEDNMLRIYRTDTQQGALVTRDITEFLELTNKKKEADIEGSALVGDTLFFITSHGRNKDGEIKRNRYQLFALRLRKTGDALSFERVGRSYTHLLEDMLEEKGFGELALDPLKPEVDTSRAPEKEGATNIEGLCAWQDRQLLIAFRNPVPGGRTLLVPLVNPARVLEGEKARFGKPIRLDLGGQGIRSIEFWREKSLYLIVAGPFNDQGSFGLYRWSGDPAQQPQRIEDVDLSGLNPEAIVIYPDRDELQLLSDDGGREMAGKACKDLEDAQKEFRSRWIPLPGLKRTTPR